VDSNVIAFNCKCVVVVVFVFVFLVVVSIIVTGGTFLKYK
jgi:hypothetical protein